MSDAARTSVLAEVKALSMASLNKVLKNKAESERFFNALSVGGKPSIAAVSKLFVTIGMARNIRIDEDWGTQAIYGIGSPTRPILVPNNYSVSMSIERLQLDARDNFSYVTSPDYWYSKHFQKRVGAADWPLYTYIYIHDREKAASDVSGNKGISSVEMYAMLPRTASKAISSSDVMLVHSVQMVGFKYQYLDFIGDLMGANTSLGDGSNLLSYGRTTEAGAPTDFGSVQVRADSADRATAQNNAGGR